MKAVIVVLAVSFLFCAVGECGKPVVKAALAFNTGDVEFDLALNTMNAEAKLDVKVFIGNLSLSFGNEKKDLAKLISEDKMEPMDVYMALTLARLTEKSLEDVVKAHKANKKKGWGVIAKSLGIKPGSKAFHALKKSGTDRLKKVKKDKEEKGKGKKKGKKKRKKK